MTPTPDYLARLDELVAQTKEPKPDLPPYAGSVGYAESKDGHWKSTPGNDWEPMHHWSTDPAAAAQLRQEARSKGYRVELLDAESGGIICRSWVFAPAYRFGVGATEEEATANWYLDFVKSPKEHLEAEMKRMGVEVPDGK